MSKKSSNIFYFLVNRLTRAFYWATCGKPGHKMRMFFRRREPDKSCFPQFLAAPVNVDLMSVCFKTSGSCRECINGRVQTIHL